MADHIGEAEACHGRRYGQRLIHRLPAAKISSEKKKLACLPSPLPSLLQLLVVTFVLYKELRKVVTVTDQILQVVESAEWI